MSPTLWGSTERVTELPGVFGEMLAGLPTAEMVPEAAVVVVVGPVVVVVDNVVVVVVVVVVVGGGGGGGGATDTENRLVTNDVWLLAISSNESVRWLSELELAPITT
jgi:hypothetical protein